jgi:biopolymer transport protein ExbD
MSELLPVTKPQRRFALTPLVDVIFLLLIFFMLTSQIAPFSTIALSAKSSGKEAVLPQPDGTRAIPQKSNALITVLNGGIAINGKRFALFEIDAALARLRNSGTKSVIISPRSSATMQDLVTVLEAVKKASFQSATLRNPG